MTADDDMVHVPYRVAKALLEAHAQCVIPDVDDEL